MPEAAVAVLTGADFCGGLVKSMERLVDGFPEGVPHGAVWL